MKEAGWYGHQWDEYRINEVDEVEGDECFEDMEGAWDDVNGGGVTRRESQLFLPRFSDFICG